MGFNQQNGGFNGIYPLVMTNSSLLNMAIETVDFPLKIVMFHSYVSLPEGIQDVGLWALR